MESVEKKWEKYKTSLDDLTDDDRKSIHSISSNYCEGLLNNIDSRFPEPELLTAFYIFDAARTLKVDREK